MGNRDRSSEILSGCSSSPLKTFRIERGASWNTWPWHFFCFVFLLKLPTIKKKKKNYKTSSQSKIFRSRLEKASGAGRLPSPTFFHGRGPKSIITYCPQASSLKLPLAGLPDEQSADFLIPKKKKNVWGFSTMLSCRRRCGRLALLRMLFTMHMLWECRGILFFCLFVRKTTREFDSNVLAVTAALFNDLTSNSTNWYMTNVFYWGGATPQAQALRGHVPLPMKVFKSRQIISRPARNRFL